MFSLSFYIMVAYLELENFIYFNPISVLAKCFVYQLFIFFLVELLCWFLYV